MVKNFAKNKISGLRCSQYSHLIKTKPGIGGVGKFIPLYCVDNEEIREEQAPVPSQTA
jgi:hypothetical protein